MKTIVCATGNPNKLREISEITGSLGIRVISRAEAGVPASFDVVEDGSTFEENALKKARAIAELTGLPAIADDSGLMVDALDGAPGVYSARFAGESHDDRKNNEKLLRLLSDVPDVERTAAFVSVIALTDPAGETITARGECPGRILREERGCGGFGYDPLFVPDGWDVTFAEMRGEDKNRISHRARALAELRRLLSEKTLEHEAFKSDK